MTRRRLLLASLASPALLAAAKVEERTVTPKKMFTAPGGGHPNGLQATADGLWILDQGDNKAYLVGYDGKLERELQTEADRGSGIGFDGKSLWIASTYNRKTLDVDPLTGKTIRAFETPGSGVVAFAKNPNQPATGGHGIEFHSGKMWIAVPPAVKIYRIDPKDHTVEHVIPAPGERPHGISFQGEALWCAESNHMAFYKLDPETGAWSEKLKLAEGSATPHGMSIWKGELWYSDADGGGGVYKIPL
jgi:streptogramin lyase